VVFWLSQDSNVTPPVALAAYAASGIAGASPMRAGLQAWKFAKGLYLIPLLMVYAPGILLDGSPAEIAFDIVIALSAVVGLVPALEGHQFAPVRWLERILLGGAVIALFFPEFWLKIGAIALIGLVLTGNYWRARRGVQSATA
jgi:TRAP-type uncharacterized transport system fused permease subunit